MLTTKPTHYTAVEGGDWFEWKNHSKFGGRFGQRTAESCAAIRFDNNMVFDLITGEWRKYPSFEELVQQAFIREFAHELRVRSCMSNVGRLDCTLEAVERALRAVLLGKTIEVKK